MKKLYLIVLLIPFFGISQKACNVFGKIKFVEYGEDYIGNKPYLFYLLVSRKTSKNSNLKLSN